MSDERNKAGDVLAELDDPSLRAALRDFRGSVHAWSDAAYGARRPVAAHPAGAWRRPLVWALSLALSAGAVSGALYERHHQAVLAQQQQRELQRELQMEQQEKQMAAVEHARESEDLLAKIDSDISREVPSAMEPLAQLMTDSGGAQ